MKISLLLTILAVTIAAVAKYPVQNQTVRSTIHNQNSQTKFVELCKAHRKNLPRLLFRLDRRAELHRSR